MSKPNDPSISPQILDSVAQNSTSVLANSPSVALSMFYQAAGQAFAINMQNAASNQQNLNALNTPIVANAVKAVGGAGKG